MADLEKDRDTVERLAAILRSQGIALDRHGTAPKGVQLQYLDAWALVRLAQAHLDHLDHEVSKAASMKQTRE